MTADERLQLRAMPKAELHLHLEGSLSPETLWTLAQRQGAPLGLDSLVACCKLYEFSDFAGFIQAIKTASLLLTSPADYATAVAGLAQYLRSQGVVYSEVFLSLGILLWRGVAVEPYWAAIEQARAQAEAQTGVRLRWIFDAVRQFGAEPFERVVNWAIKLQTSGSVLAIGIGGDETQRPASEFATGYARARDYGLRTTIHAGETCGPASIWAALKHLQPDRIGHGLHAFLDERLLGELARRQIPLEICPTSNYKTGAWHDSLPYPAHSYYKRGIKLVISSDDPGIFGCTLQGEYAWLGDQGGFSYEELRGLAAQSLALAFEPINPQ
ncbi:MAG: adenosine deaminase [Terriglobales bacterium]